MDDDTSASGKPDKAAWGRILASVRREVESGTSGPDFRNSLLGLWTMIGNWINLEDDLFAIHVGWGEEKTTSHKAGMPFEFVPVSLNVLDAYATCVLAEDFLIPEGEEIVLSISLDTGETVLPSMREASDLWVSLIALSGGKPCMITNGCHLDLQRSLSAAFETKEMHHGIWSRPCRPDLVFLSDLQGCAVRMPYPGQMRAVKAYYLLHHPAEEWPRATLRFPVTNELRHRARKVVDFLLSAPSASACEN